MTLDALHAHLAAHPLVALYLTTPGCGPCAAVRPWVEARLDGTPWVFTPVQSPESPEVVGQLLVFAHPTLVLFVDGREVERFSRIVRRDAVEQALQRIDTLLG